MHADGSPAATVPPARGVLALVVAGLLLGCLVAGARGLYRPDEGRYTAVALRMLDTGNWLDPELNHETPHFSKPPLTYWLLAASMGTLGQHTLAARLPNALALAATAWLLLLAGRRLLPARPWLPAALYGLSACPRIAAGIITTDTLLTLWTTLAGVGFACWRFDEARPVRWLRVMWLGLALGFLTKGPPALLPLLGIVAFTAWQDGGRALARLLAPSGLLLFVLVALPWYVAVVLRHPGLAEHFLVHEVVERVASDTHRRNPEAIYLVQAYVPLLLVGTFPWLLDTWRGLARAARELRHPARAAGDPVQRFLLCWLLLPTLVLFLSRSRLPLYLLQVFPPLVLLAARAAPPGRLAGRHSAKVVAGLMLLVAGVLVGSRWLPLGDDTRVLARELERVLPFAPREVVFLRKPHYGLALYLGCEVEEIGYDARTNDAGVPLDTLEVELAEGDRQQAFLVDLKRDPRVFAQRAADAGADLVRLADAGDYAVFAWRADIAP